MGFEQPQYNIIKTPNARFLYQKGEGPFWNGASAARQTHLLLRQIPQSQKAEPYSYIYPDSSAPAFASGTPFWAGIMVIGLVDLQGQQDFALQDFNQGLAFSFPFTLKSSDDFFQAQDFEAYKNERVEILQKKGIQLSPIWRIRFALLSKVQTKAQNTLELRAEMHFFMKDHLDRSAFS